VNGLRRPSQLDAMVGLLGWTAYVSNGGERQRNFPASEYVAVRLTLDRAPADNAAGAEAAEAESRRQFRATYAELSRRLSAEPAVIATTYGMGLPGMNLQDFRIDVDGASSTEPAATFVRTTQVGVNYFDTFNAAIAAGRGFSACVADSADRCPGGDMTAWRFERRLLYSGFACRRIGASDAPPAETGP
jgi:hypothetical protein